MSFLSDKLFSTASLAIGIEELRIIVAKILRRDDVEIDDVLSTIIYGKHERRTKYI